MAYKSAIFYKSFHLLDGLVKSGTDLQIIATPFPENPDYQRPKNPTNGAESENKNTFYNISTLNEEAKKQFYFAMPNTQERPLTWKEPNPQYKSKGRISQDWTADTDSKSDREIRAFDSFMNLVGATVCGVHGAPSNYPVRWTSVSTELEGAETVWFQQPPKKRGTAGRDFTLRDWLAMPGVPSFKICYAQVVEPAEGSSSRSSYVKIVFELAPAPYNKEHKVVSSAQPKRKAEDATEEDLEKEAQAKKKRLNAKKSDKDRLLEEKIKALEAEEEEHARSAPPVARTTRHTK